MKLFVWQFNPKSIKISPNNKIQFVIPKEKYSEYKKLGIKNVYSLSVLDFCHVYDLLTDLRKKGLTIEDVFTLDEHCMDWVGLLKEIFVSSAQSFSNILFKDKYYMRSSLKNVIDQPRFSLISSDNIEKIKMSKAIVKPRRSDSGKGLIVTHGKLDSSILKNGSGYLDDNEYLIEEFIDYDIMFTVDGYTDFLGHERFFSHEYDTKITDFKYSPYMTIHTSSLYYNNQEKLKELFSLSKKVLKKMAIPGEITPFHFEWFYNRKNGRFIFTEVGKRFGGVKIPNLINSSFGIDLLNEYWALQEGRKNEIDYSGDTFHPNFCSTTYLQFENGKKMKKSLANDVPNSFFYEQYVPIAHKSKQAETVEDVFFLTQFTVNSIEESIVRAKEINKIFESVTY